MSDTGAIQSRLCYGGGARGGAEYREPPLKPMGVKGMVPTDRLWTRPQGGISKSTPFWPSLQQMVQIPLSTVGAELGQCRVLLGTPPRQRLSQGRPRGMFTLEGIKAALGVEKEMAFGHRLGTTALAFVMTLFPFSSTR